MFQIKRIYDGSSDKDGYRILVDRLWPRGITKERAALDLWLKGIAPSPALRVWFNHEPAKFNEFQRRYMRELETNPSVAELKRLTKHHPTITLLYGAKDPVVNHVAVLQKFLQTK